MHHPAEQLKFQPRVKQKLNSELGFLLEKLFYWKLIEI